MTPDWPGDTAPLPRHVGDDRLGKRPDEDSALAEAHRLRFSGCQRVVAWRWDQNDEGGR